MNLLDQHIRKHLLHFHNEKDIFFQEIVALIQHEIKEQDIFLLHYIHLLLEEAFSKKENKPHVLHLHFANNLDDNLLLIIAQYLLIRSFNESYRRTNSSNPNHERLEQLRIKLRSEWGKISICPDGASGKNGGNRVYKSWIRQKQNIKSLIDFYDNLDRDISTNAIFNCQVRLCNMLNDFLSKKPYAGTIEDYTIYPTFNLLNTKSSFNQIDEVDNSIIDNLETVILFDCERKSLMQTFALNDLTDYDNNLKKYLILSFGNRYNSVNILRDKLILVQNRFKIPLQNSYPIFQSEIDFCLGRESTKYIPVSFVGIDNSSFWETFVLETSIQDLYELRSIKMMNLYSLCLNVEIKKFILEDVFSESDISELVSEETKQRLFDLSDEDRSVLKNSLENILDLFIASDLKQILLEKINNETLLVVDDFILKSKRIKQLVFSVFQLLSQDRLRSWADFNDIKGNDILVLSYQDQGKYPYYFYPNIIETTVSKNIVIEAIYHKFLFYSRYQWAKYNVANDLYKLSNHPIRQKYFHWERLKNSINTLRPHKEDSTNWDLEQQYSGNVNRETVKVKLKGEKEKTFTSSELFIYSTDRKSFKVAKIGDIIDTIDEDEKCFIHHLDEIQENINLYEKMINTNQQDEELNVIRKKFQIDENETGRLWKILLKQKVVEVGEVEVYEEFKSCLNSNGLKMVSFSHFKNNWLNPESESIAPLNKKIFIELCNFLNLPKTYFILIQRLRNTSKQSNRQSTRQMNRLLQDLFNEGSFDEGQDIVGLIQSNLEKYIRKHPLDELGIDEKYLGDNLVALVELIKTELTLKEVEKIKKVE